MEEEKKSITEMIKKMKERRARIVEGLVTLRYHEDMNPTEAASEEEEEC